MTVTQPIQSPDTLSPGVTIAEPNQDRASLASLVNRTDAEIHKSTIMVVDDELVNVKVVRKYLKDSGYEEFVTTTDSRKALALIKERRPDVVILDVMMPHIDGLQILTAVRQEEELSHIPILILTASEDSETKVRALELGASDFLRKPVDPAELIVRVRNVLIVKRYMDQMADYSTQLEREVQSRTQEVNDSRAEVIHALACAGEQRDSDTGSHVIRVARFAGILAAEMGMEKSQVELLEQTAVLHDVGKIGIPDAIMQKPGKLTEDEFKVVQKHCELGRNILLGVAGNAQELKKTSDEREWSCRSPILQTAARIAMSHHEKWDGSGYPAGLKGEDIPIEGRICAVADVFDALSSKRPYKEAFGWDKCCKILKEGRGQHFDPRVVDAFFARQDDIREVQRRYAD